MFGIPATAALYWATKMTGIGALMYGAGKIADLVAQSRAQQTSWDLYQHATLMGATGAGKTNALKWSAKDLLDRGWSVWWFSVQRRSADELLSSLSDRQVDQAIWLCPDEPAPLKLNLLSCSRNTSDEWALIAEQTVSIFSQLDSSWGANIGEVMGNAVYAALEWGASAGRQVTLWDTVRLLCEEDYRAEVVAAATQPAVRAFFATVLPSIQPSVVRAVARILRLMRNNHLLRVLSSPDSINVGELMESPGTRFVVADMHGLGSPMASALFLSIVLAKIEAVTYGRGAWARPTALFLDEFHLYATSALTNLLEQGRRHNMSLWLACQGTWQGAAAEHSAWQTGTWHIFRPEALRDAGKLARAVDRDEAALKGLPNLVSISRRLVRGQTRPPVECRWPIYPDGSADRLRVIKQRLLRRRQGIPEWAPPTIDLPNVPPPPPRAEGLPRVVGGPVIVHETPPRASEGAPSTVVPVQTKGGRVRL